MEDGGDEKKTGRRDKRWDPQWLYTAVANTGGNTAGGAVSGPSLSFHMMGGWRL